MYVAGIPRGAVSLPLILPQTPQTDSPDFYMRFIYTPHCFYSIRDLQSVKPLVAEITDHTALCTHEMMVRVRVCIKPDSFTQRTGGCDEFKIQKQPQGTINRIKRYSGYPFTNISVDCFSVGMISGFDDFPENLQTLIRYF